MGSVLPQLLRVVSEQRGQFFGPIAKNLLSDGSLPEWILDLLDRRADCDELLLERQTLQLLSIEPKVFEPSVPAGRGLVGHVFAGGLAGRLDCLRGDVELLGRVVQLLGSFDAHSQFSSHGISLSPSVAKLFGGRRQRYDHSSGSTSQYATYSHHARSNRIQARFNRPKEARDRVRTAGQGVGERLDNITSRIE